MAWVPADCRTLEEVRNYFGPDKLGAYLSAGYMQAFELYRDGTGKMVPIPVEFWRTKKSKVVMDLGSTRRVNRVSGEYEKDKLVLIQIPASALQPETRNPLDNTPPEPPTAEKRSGGRPPADWDAVFIAAACIVAADGLPTTQAAFISSIQERLGDKAPGDTQMKERIGPLFREVKKALS